MIVGLSSGEDVLGLVLSACAHGGGSYRVLGLVLTACAHGGGSYYPHHREIKRSPDLDTLGSCFDISQSSS
jgi:hypothetical protein